MRNINFTAYIEQDEDGMFIGSVPSIPSCYAQGKTQKELLDNLQEVLKLCLRNLDTKPFDKTKFVGIQNLKLKHA
ncbi:type II toxin-antitoxin system HicB family antitoxin [Candidatus Falkowbacteria bacterium]|nr:type II toxin-antitoxin system HicB family antitoxin [Candidatus Falkowbacteria bacterium]